MISVYRKILGILTPHSRRRFWLLLGLVMIASLLEVASIGGIFPFLSLLSDPDLAHTNKYMAWAYQTLGFETVRGFQIFVGFCAFLSIVLGLAVKAGSFYLITRFSTMCGFSISSRLLQGYLHQPYVWFLNRNSADLGKSVLMEAIRLTNGMILPAMKLFSSLTLVLIMVAFLVIVQPIPALTLAGLITLTYGIIYMTLRPVFLRMGKETIEANEARFRISQEAMGGIKDVKLLGLENAYIHVFNRPAKRLANLSANSTLLGEMPRFLLEGVAFGGIVIALLYMLISSNGGIETIVPVLGFFALAGLRLFPAMQQVYGMISKIRTTTPLLDTIHEELNSAWTRKPQWREGKAPAPHGVQRDIVLEDIHFTYPQAERPILDGLSLTIPVGSTVGMIGGTGAGKTTAIDIILGLLEPDTGRLLVDGAHIRGDALWPWQRAIGYVPQHIFLIDDTIAANIAFGHAIDSIDHDALVRAAKAAELHEFIETELPDGYQTTVGERGVRLSGGQRQRIGIARALYHNPDVLILDEATSALDNTTEHAVLQAIHNLGRDKTVIMIAHRLSTVETCDKIFFLQKGQVLAEGTYQQLLENSPEFRALLKPRDPEAA